MIESLSLRERRLVAIAMLLGLLGLLAALAWLPVAYMQRQEAELVAVERRIAELQRRLPVREGLLAQERLLARSGETEGMLLEGETAPIAAATLQGDLTALAAAMGGELTTVQILDPEQIEPFAEIGVRLTLAGDTATLRDFLYAVETHTPVLIVRTLDVALRGSDAASPEDPQLSASMEIVGYAPSSILR